MVEDQIEARGVKDSRVLEAMRETEFYLTSADVEAQRKNREEALRRLAGLLATRFFDAVSEGVAP